MCPLSSSCQAYKNGNQADFPVKIKKTATKLTNLHLMRYLCLEDGKILLYQKRKGEWLEAQWEVPTTCIQTADKDFKQYPAEERVIPDTVTLKSAITRYKIHNYALSTCKNELLENIPSYKEREMEFFDIKNLPLISTATKKILTKLELIWTKTKETGRSQLA